MTGAARDSSLERAFQALAAPGLFLGSRVISTGDEDTLREAEATSISSSSASMRRASGAARIVARGLLARLGFPDAQVPKGPGGEPIWPTEVVGSLAHDDEIAVAAVGLRRDFASIGIDVEPAAALPPDMLELVTTARERHGIADDPLEAKLLFSAKEAVYKAVYPLDRVFLEFGDIEVDLAACAATTQTGRTLTLRWSISSRIMTLALIDAERGSAG